MPQRSPMGSNAHAAPEAQQTPATPSRPTEPTQPQRLIKLQARLGSQANDPQKGWLGVDMEPLELPLALSLGLPNAGGALLLKAVSGGPADRAGIRFGDIVVALNGGIVPNINDLRQRIASVAPGSEARVEVWRAAGEGEEFLPVLCRLADSANTHVMYRLGRMYAAGSGVARDDTEAVHWYRRAADAGNLNATTALAVAHLDGRGTPVDPQAGLRLLRLAAARDHVEAANRLGHILLEGRLADKDALEAARLFTKAADAGHPPSMVDVGSMYANGNGLQTDFARAAMWYKRAADLGNTPGMVNLGWLYEWGKGVPAYRLYPNTFWQGPHSGGIPLRPQPRPMGKPLLDLGLKTASERIVELRPGQAVGEIILTRERLWGAVVVFVARAVALLLHEARWRVEDVLGRRQTAVLLGGAHGGTERKVGGVGFGCRR